jgi:hypothetical protein
LTQLDAEVFNRGQQKPSTSFNTTSNANAKSEHLRKVQDVKIQNASKEAYLTSMKPHLLALNLKINKETFKNE